MATIYNTREINNQIRNDITAQLADDVIAKLHNITSEKNSSADIISELKSLGYKINSRNREEQVAVQNFLSKVIDDYKIKNERKIQFNMHMQAIKLGLSETENPDFKVDRQGQFYKIENNEYVEQNDIIEISAKYYVKKEPAKLTADSWIISYDSKNKPISYKFVNNNNVAYKSKEFVAKKLPLKKEYVKRFRLHGYNGNGSGFFAGIGNALTKPIPSGCYIDKNYNIFKWDNFNHTFIKVIRTGTQVGAPMVSDYEFKGDTVIRTDYDGYGLMD